MAFDIKSLKKQLDQSDKIVTPRLIPWLLQHGDDPFPSWVLDELRRLMETVPRNRSASFSASSAGTCARAQIYGYLGMPATTPDAQLANIFMDGKWRHLRWQGMLLSAGILDSVEGFQTWGNKRTKGSTDGFGVVPDNHPRNTWRGQEFGFELKGVSTFQFAKYSSDNTFKPGHLEQIARYFVMTGWPLFVSVYEDKTTQDWLERVIEASLPSMQRLMQEQVQELDALNDYVNTRTLPDRIPPCARLSGPEYHNCPYGGSRTSTCAVATLWPSVVRKKV